MFVKYPCMAVISILERCWLFKNFDAMFSICYKERKNSVMLFFILIMDSCIICYLEKVNTCKNVKKAKG